MYARHVVFGEDRRGFEEGRFWFQDGLHAAEPLYPFDSFAFEYGVVAINQASSRLFVVPPSLGAECRLLNGYVYLSANPVTDEATLARRAELLARPGRLLLRALERALPAMAGDRWKPQRRTSPRLEVPEMPEVEDESIVTEGRGLGSSHALLHAYDRLIEGVDRIFQYHFEFLNLGYAAYLAFYERCRQAFPDISDQTIATMVSAIDVLVLRPDDELRRLARLAFELGVSEQVASAENEEELAASPRGQRSRRTVARRLRADEGPVVLLLLRNGRVPSPPSLLDRRHQVPDPDDRLLHRAARRRRGHRTPRRVDARRAGAGHRGAPRAGPSRTAPMPSTRASRSPERSSPTSRTTTSRSTTGTSRSSGTRCASSVRSSRATGSSRTERTSSCSATTRCAPLWRSSGSTGARVGQGWRAARSCGRLSWSGGGRSTHAMCAWAQPPALGPLHEDDHRPDHDHALGDHGRARARLALVRRRRGRDA